MSKPTDGDNYTVTWNNLNHCLFHKDFVCSKLGKQKVSCVTSWKIINPFFGVFLSHFSSHPSFLDYFYDVTLSAVLSRFIFLDWMYHCFSLIFKGNTSKINEKYTWLGYWKIPDLTIQKQFVWLIKRNKIA